MDERASLPVATVMLRAMKLLAELCLVVLGDVNALLQLVPPVSVRAL